MTMVDPSNGLDSPTLKPSLLLGKCEPRGSPVGLEPLLSRGFVSAPHA